MRLAHAHLNHDGLAHLGGNHLADLGVTQVFLRGCCCALCHYLFLALPASPEPALLSLPEAASAFSRMMVFTRATSLRSPRIFFRLSVCPILSWNLRRKSWSLSSCSCCLSSASVKFLIFSASINSSSL